jgi:hypothetical protein
LIYKRFSNIINIVGAIFILLPCIAAAGGVSPYLPLNKSPEIERQIERLMILAGRPVMTRPVPAAIVLEALDDVRQKDSELCEQVEHYLQRYMHEAGLTQLRAEVSLNSGDSEQIIPNQYGKTIESSWQVTGELFYQPFDYAIISLGGIAYDGRTTPTGSMLSVGMDIAQLDIGYREHWLSPFTDSSMLISTEAPTMPSITLSNYKPITSLGLSYELFFAKMSESSRITCQNGDTKGKPRLGGIQLRAEPVKGYALSLNRQLQFGGGERNNYGLNDFLNAFFNPAKYDNKIAEDDRQSEFGNQQVSFTAQMIFPARQAFAVYFEFAGEDTSRFQNYLLGNASFSVGIDFPSLWNRFDFTYETTEWQNSWYVHHIYQDGLSNHGYVVGHWFGDQRRSGDGAGGVSHMVRLGWQTEDGDYLQAVCRILKNNSYTSFAYKDMREFGLSYSFPWSRHLIGGEAYIGQDIFGSRFMRLSTSVNFGQGWLASVSGAASSVSDADDKTELFVDMGVTYGKIKSYCGNFAIENNDKWVRYSGNPHLGFGVRRNLSEHNDLGTRLEWDRVNGSDLVSIRIADYRYRINNYFAINGFFGVGRYNPDTSAYGWYFGVGPQYLNIFKKWDFGIDARLHLKMAHDKVVHANSSESYTAETISSMGVVTYISRRF